MKYNVTGDLNLSKNYFLGSLEGLPEEIGDSLDIRVCISLTSLDHKKQQKIKVHGDLKCDDKWNEKDILNYFDVGGKIDNKYPTKTFGLLLHRADLRTTKELLKRTDIDINDIDSDTKMSPFLEACFYSQMNVAKELLGDSRVDVNVQDEDHSRTAFMNCVLNGKSKVYDMLLERKDVNLNLVDSDGNTALVLACKEGRTDMVEDILSRRKDDVDVNIKNARGKTALDYSLHALERAELLKKYGAKSGKDI